MDANINDYPQALPISGLSRCTETLIATSVDSIILLVILTCFSFTPILLLCEEWPFGPLGSFFSSILPCDKEFIGHISFVIDFDSDTYIIMRCRQIFSLMHIGMLIF